MNKNLLAVILFPVVVNGCISDPFESEKDVDIITDSSSYTLTEELKIKVSFKNHLSRDVRIVNDNCEVPSFILEKGFNNTWQQVYFSNCLKLPVYSVFPTILESRQTLTIEISIHISNIQTERLEGEYRFVFNLIEKDNYNRLPEKYMYSNVFNILE